MVTGRNLPFAIRTCSRVSNELWDDISILTPKAFPGAPEATHNSIGVRAYLAALSPCFNKGVGDFESKSITEAAPGCGDGTGVWEGRGVPNCQLCRNTVFI